MEVTHTPKVLQPKLFGVQGDSKLALHLSPLSSICWKLEINVMDSGGAKQERIKVSMLKNSKSWILEELSKRTIVSMLDNSKLRI